MLKAEKTPAYRIFESIVAMTTCGCEEKTIGLSLRGLWVFHPCKQHREVYDILDKYMHRRGDGSEDRFSE